MILLSPALLVAFNPAGFLFPRYFLINISFFLLLLSRFLVHRLLRRGRIGILLFVAFLSSYAWGNGRKTLTFYKYGRGQYLAAVKLMAEETPGDIITVGSEHEFANKMILRFYGRYLPPNKHIVYCSGRDWTAKEPQWAIVHKLSHDYVPPVELTARNGNHYIFRKDFLYSDYAGWNWFLYRLKANSLANNRTL
jgi:hypothetical protein